MALALTALACGLLLGGLSAWFLGSVAIAGMSAAAFTFNFHIPGALVRLFAVGRTAAKYGERLVGHKAALTDQVTRRVNLFRAMAGSPAIRRTGWQLGDEARLADYIDDVEDLDYAKLRIDLPTISLGIGLIGGLLATAIVTPFALLPIGVLLLAVLFSAARLAGAGAIAWKHRRALQRRGAQKLGMAMASAVPLWAEDAWPVAITDALDQLSEAERGILAVSRQQAMVDALAVLLGPVALLSIVGVAWWMGLRSEGLLVPLFLGFAWFALGETMQGASRIMVARFRRQTAQAEIGRWTNVLPDLRSANQISSSLQTLKLSALPRCAPDGRLMGEPITLHLQAGQPTVFTGPSGCGKTSLLKQIAGWIGSDAIVGDAKLLSALDRQMASCFCPHDAAILADTVRANFFARGAADDELWQALAAVEMKERIELAGGLNAWITQDVLSLGEAQRLNLARVWLSDRPIILLDEPTEHIDEAQGVRILHRLLEHLRGRVVVLSSHRAFDLRHATTIRL
ncbi:ATP-binding cassette domain-containing protein [Mesorhizobium sp. SB112]|uniref:ATP-binding cassette domain-containing protein n=1 Tax=Mesorhizobium sp. SB112 TaxID=3151853 RepID=UPI003265E2F9